ncbi:MAG TPA: DUF5615 family PIN-like protein [Fimbriimonadaceae bacterium]|nr:DUF5615 family PIN-like protein [Fimbriimonadaceae bacterium]
MALLFDANLSPRLVGELGLEYPGSEHIEALSLRTPDFAVWKHALESNLIIVSKDSDFETLALLVGPPGKAIRITLGNCSTWAVAALLRESLERVRAFATSSEESLLVLP